MIRTVGVVVPACNEQVLMADCLAALADARSHAHRHARGPLAIRVVVVLDSCHDATAEIVAAHRGVESVACAVGRVGAARRLGARAILARAGHSLDEVWLANTDADSQVPPDWITRMLVEADRGAHLVLGTVLPDHGLDPVRTQRWHSRHTLRDGHAHVHGANLGIRADAYATLGGWQPLDSGEDVVLADRARASGHLRIARTASVPVITSARLTGRAPAGFAGYLRELPLAASA